MPPTPRYLRRRLPRRSSRLQRAQVAIPQEIPNTMAVFLVLRKMRRPLLLMLAVMTMSVVGLSLMPGVVQPDGSNGRLTGFEAFYVFSYTATTIGFGEIPHEFSAAQRWWVIGSIYASVMGWAYTLSRLMSLLQDSAFNAAYTTQSVRRTIAHLRQPFTLIIGYGFVGRTVAQALDNLGRRLTVLDNQTVAVERLSTDLLRQEVPGICGDARNPAMIGLAGLSHPDCNAVLAMTGDEAVNLQIVMTCSLLRPELPVIARASSRRIAQAMTAFSPTAVINPYDEYGNFLALSLHRPYVHRLITWLVSHEGTELPDIDPASRPDLPTWLVMSDDQFGEEISQDLTEEGFAVSLVDPADHPDFNEFSAVIVGAADDTTNLALAAHLRHSYPDIFLVVRQHSHARLPLLDAFCPDSVFFPPQLITQRTIANLISTRFWDFLTGLAKADDKVIEDLTRQLVNRVGHGSPVLNRLTIGMAQTPTVVRWLHHRPLALDVIFRSPLNWQQPIAAFPLMIVRDESIISLPGDDTELQVGDEIVMAATHDALAEQYECLYDDSTLFYAATGRDIPTSRAWRWLTNQRWKDAFDDGLPEPTADTSRSKGSPPE